MSRALPGGCRSSTPKFAGSHDNPAILSDSAGLRRDRILGGSGIPVSERRAMRRATGPRGMPGIRRSSSSPTSRGRTGRAALYAAARQSDSGNLDEGRRSRLRLHAVHTLVFFSGWRRAISGWLTPSAVIRRCVSRIWSGNWLEKSSIHWMSFSGSTRASSAILRQCRAWMLLKRYSPPSFIATFAFLSWICVWYGMAVARSYSGARRALPCDPMSSP